MNMDGPEEVQVQADNVPTSSETSILDLNLNTTDAKGPTTVEKFSAAKETSPAPAQDEMSLDNNNSVKVTNTIDANLNMIDPSALFVMKVKMRTGGVVASPMRDNRKDLDGFVRESEFILGSRRKIAEVVKKSGAELVLLNSMKYSAEMMGVLRMRENTSEETLVDQINSLLSSTSLYVEISHQSPLVAAHLDHFPVKAKVDGSGVYKMNVEYNPSERSALRRSLDALNILKELDCGDGDMVLLFGHDLEFQAAYADLHAKFRVEIPKPKDSDQSGSSIQHSQSKFIFLASEGFGLRVDRLEEDLRKVLIGRETTVAKYRRLGSNSFIIEVESVISSSVLKSNSSLQAVLVHDDVISWRLQQPGSAGQTNQPKKDTTPRPQQSRIKKRERKGKVELRLLEDKLTEEFLKGIDHLNEMGTLEDSESKWVVSQYTKYLLSDGNVEKLQEKFKPHGKLEIYTVNYRGYKQRRLDFHFYNEENAKAFSARLLRSSLLKLSDLGLDLEPVMTESEYIMASTRPLTIVSESLPSAVMEEKSEKIAFRFRSVEDINLCLLKSENRYIGFGELKNDPMHASLRPLNGKYAMQVQVNLNDGKQRTETIMLNCKMDVFATLNKGGNASISKDYVHVKSRSKSAVVPLTEDGTRLTEDQILSIDWKKDSLLHQQISALLKTCKPSTTFKEGKLEFVFNDRANLEDYLKSSCSNPSQCFKTRPVASLKDMVQVSTAKALNAKVLELFSDYAILPGDARSVLELSKLEMYRALVSTTVEETLPDLELTEDSFSDCIQVDDTCTLTEKDICSILWKTELEGQSPRAAFSAGLATTFEVSLAKVYFAREEVVVQFDSKASLEAFLTKNCQEESNSLSKVKQLTQRFFISKPVLLVGFERDLAKASAENKQEIENGSYKVVKNETSSVFYFEDRVEALQLLGKCAVNQNLPLYLDIKSVTYHTGYVSSPTKLNPSRVAGTFPSQNSRDETRILTEANVCSLIWNREDEDRNKAHSLCSGLARLFEQQEVEILGEKDFYIRFPSETSLRRFLGRYCSGRSDTIDKVRCLPQKFQFDSFGGLRGRNLSSCILDEEEKEGGPNRIKYTGRVNDRQILDFKSKFEALHFLKKWKAIRGTDLSYDRLAIKKFGPKILCRNPAVSNTSEDRSTVNATKPKESCTEKTVARAEELEANGDDSTSDVDSRSDNSTSDVGSDFDDRTGDELDSCDEYIGCCDEYEETERSSPGPPLPFVPQDVSQEESDASVAFVASRFNEDTLFNLFAIQIDTLEMEAGGFDLGRLVGQLNRVLRTNLSPGLVRVWFFKAKDADRTVTSLRPNIPGIIRSKLIDVLPKTHSGRVAAQCDFVMSFKSTHHTEEIHRIASSFGKSCHKLEVTSEICLLRYENPEDLLIAFSNLMVNPQFSDLEIETLASHCTKVIQMGDLGLYCLKIVPNQEDTPEMVLNDLALAAPVASSQNSFTDRTQLTVQKDLPIYVEYKNVAAAGAGYAHLWTKYNVTIPDPIQLAPETEGGMYVLNYTTESKFPEFQLDDEEVFEHFQTLCTEVCGEEGRFRLKFKSLEELRLVYGEHSHDKHISVPNVII